MYTGLLPLLSSCTVVVLGSLGAAWEQRKERRASQHAHAFYNAAAADVAAQQWVGASCRFALDGGSAGGSASGSVVAQGHQHSCAVAAAMGRTVMRWPLCPTHSSNTTNAAVHGAAATGCTLAFRRGPQLRHLPCTRGPRGGTRVAPGRVRPSCRLAGRGANW